MVGGEWKDWNRGTAVSSRNESVNRALRTVFETRKCPVYPGGAPAGAHSAAGRHCWALERWWRPEAYGTREAWYSPVTAGGTMRWIPGENRYIAALGVYPERGDYESMDIWYNESTLTESLLCGAIGFMEQQMNDLPPTIEERVRREISRGIEQRQQQDELYDKQAMEILGQVDDPLMARTPGGQAEAHRIAESIGIRSQLF
jgi:hypothetical protein